MDMDRPKPTRRQLERNLSQRIQALYRSYLESQPAEVACQIFDNKIAIVLENFMTRPVQLLAEQGKRELAQQVRFNLNKALEPQLKALIEEVVGVPVIDWLSDAKLESGHIATIAILADPPEVGSVKSEKASADGDE
ncbi:DUF2294 domain-containing protein [Microseira wollei]|uniref:Na+-translocating membrane potential-generating system MpsC domain-containing protein n=1 Tax=Microseira wollei NIES-4236 TaxID=2530354 RepID=A0AAV3XIL4_9CYAN|nr:DUF2294 domain-containing protein [Microseira wollei]GET42289.1 protein of unknown function DUF2294 [Microseira wollei NIES-4236]